jgi:hypothetical protein
VVTLALKMKEDSMSSAFFYKQQQYVSDAASGYLFFAVSLVMILVFLMEGWLW